MNNNGVEDEYWNAWGYDGDNWDYSSECDDYGNYYLGNSMVLLEIKTKEQPIEDTTAVTEIDVSKYAAYERDSLKGTTVATPMLLQNKYQYLQTDDDSADDEGETALAIDSNDNHDDHHCNRTQTTRQ